MTDWLVDDSLAPNTDGSLQPMYTAAADGVLVMPFCDACHIPLELEQVRCDSCGSSVGTWRPVEPIGVVHSVTTVHRREPGLIVATIPYHVVDVELTSGHRVLMTTSAATDQSPAIGDHADITFRRITGVAVPALEVTR
jgi:uncharacterized protein